MGILLPWENEHYLWKIINNRNQDAGESIDTYASSLRSLSDRCNFGTLKKEMMRQDCLRSSWQQFKKETTAGTGTYASKVYRYVLQHRSYVDAIGSYVSAKIHTHPHPMRWTLSKSRPKVRINHPLWKTADFVIKRMRKKDQTVQPLEKFALFVKKRIILPWNVPKKKKTRNRKPSHKHSVNQFDFGESEEEILSVSCTEEEINVVDNHLTKILTWLLWRLGEKKRNWAGHPAMFCPASISSKELWLRNRGTPSRCTQSQPCHPLVKQKSL